MSVKEIRELEDEVREISVDGSGEDSGGWEEKDVVSEDSEEVEDKEEGEFSIGDTMLARGDAKEVWGARGLEEELEGEEFDRGFDDDVFEEEEEFGAEDFSYETMGQSGDGDLYGGVSATGAFSYETMGQGGSGSGMDLYGAAGQKGSDSVNMYNTASGQSAESSLYITSTGGGKKKGMDVSYNIEGPKKKKVRRNTEGSGLERGLNVPRVRKRRSKGVSMI